MADKPELAGRLDKLRRQVQEFKKERALAPAGSGGPRVVAESPRLAPPRPLFRSGTTPPARPLFRGSETDTPARPLFRVSDGGGRPLFQSSTAGGPIQVPPRYSDGTAPPAKRQRVAPTEQTTTTLLLQNVPADYTASTLTELHEALLLDPESIAALRFLRVSSKEGAMTPTRSVVLRYRDESSASRALEVLHDQPVVSETGETLCIEAKWHDTENAGNAAQTKKPQGSHTLWNALLAGGQAAEQAYEQPDDPEVDESAAGEDYDSGHSLRSALTRFIQENNVDEGAQDALWDLGPEDQEAILREGPCTGANPSALLMSRIRRLAMERAAYAPPVSAGDVERFLQENDIDAAAAATLRECDPEIQKRVVAEGQVTGRNPSAMVASRIRRAQQEHQSLRAQQEQQNPGPIIRPVAVKPPVASAEPVGVTYAPPVNLNPIERFLQENEIDADAAATLRECDPEVQKRVVAEGQVTGRNPSAMVVGRIRRAQQEYQSSGPTVQPMVVKPAAAAGKIVAPIRPVSTAGVGKPLAVLPPRSIQQSSSGPRPVLPQIRAPSASAGQRPASLPPAPRANGAVASGSTEGLEPLQPLLMALGAQALLGALGNSGNIPAAVRPALAAVRPAAPVRPLFTARGQQPAAPKLLRPKAAATSRRP
mmetsp:Transcript_12562/g.24555  ORF Transcript_12562/g.24555 Transcript_12562/m.24555 type:complete len:653 (-) Transcript_12562:36-1994(-)